MIHSLIGKCEHMNSVIGMCLITIVSFSVNAQELYFPPSEEGEWATTPYEELNWCEDNITSLYNYLENEQTKSFIILKEGRIVLEKYFGSYTQDSLWFWFSAGKSLMATLTGITQQNGSLNIENPTSN